MSDQADFFNKNSEIVVEIEQHKKVEEALRSALLESNKRKAEITALIESARSVLASHTFYDAAASIFYSCKNVIGATSGYIALVSEDGTKNEVSFLDSGSMSCTVYPNLPMQIGGLREVARKLQLPTGIILSFLQILGRWFKRAVRLLLL